jgi:hypothetical protein
MLLLIFLFGSYITNALKTVSPPAIKVQTKQVHLRKLADEKNPSHWATSQSPSFLSPFEIMYGCPFLLGNLPPTDPALLADYYLILTFSGNFSESMQTDPAPPYNNFC